MHWKWGFRVNGDHFGFPTKKKVCIVSKEPLSWGNTRISGGIIASKEGAALQKDMMNSGFQLNQSNLIEALMSGSEDIHDVLESWGHLYLREDDSPEQKLKIKPGGHTESRTYVSSYQGISLSNVLRYKLLSQNTNILEETIVCQLLIKDQRVYGALAFNWVKGEWIIIYAKQTIIASGGAGMLYYPHTDNMRSATGDGYALSLFVGANLIDMEQVQFIPFGIASTEGMTGLEVGDTSAAGPYGVLKNGRGEIFLDQLPSKTRELVSREIALQIKKGNTLTNGGVWLDPTENLNHSEGIGAWENAQKVGSLEALKFAYGSNCYRWKEPFEVIPTQHYFMGGIQIDNKGNTNIQGLMAVGEAVGGVHGAGRLGSMSLFEGLVFGRRVGREAANSMNPLQADPDNNHDLLISNFIKSVSKRKGSYSPFKLKRDLAKVMWEDVGIIRDEKGLEQAMCLVNEIEEKSNSLNIDWDCNGSSHIILNAIELKFMLTTAKAVIMSALERKESRGSHYRIDYPALDTNKIYNISVCYKNDHLQTAKIQKEFV
ncbi:FAD-binding protein [bacterium LRH843]|nr:FAD-binding protein [bacterium LRH843]